MSGLDEVLSGIELFIGGCNCTREGKTFALFSRTDGSTLAIISWNSYLEKVRAYCYDYRMTSKSVHKHLIKCYNCFKEVEDLYIKNRLIALIEEHMDEVTKERHPFR